MANREPKQNPVNTPAWVAWTGGGVGVAIWLAGRYLLSGWIDSHGTGMRIASVVVGIVLLNAGKSVAKSLYKSSR